MRHLGFTGTRQGMTERQHAAVERIALSFRIVVRDAGPVDNGKTIEVNAYAHHGDCLGADAQFHSIVTSLAFWRSLHPPSESQHRAFCDYDDHSGPAAYMVRNRAIVDVSDAMIAAPAEMEEQRRGGTWATIRMARQAGKPLVICFPDGTVMSERWDWSVTT